MNQIFTALLLLLATGLHAQDTIPRPASALLDQASLLKPEESAIITGMAQSFFDHKKGHAYLLIIDSLPEGQGILPYAKGVFKKWDLNNYDEGLNFIIIYAVKNHAVRIEGSDRVIELTTKQYLQDVTTNSMMPYFRKRQDFMALKRGMEMVIQKVENNE